MTSPESLSVLFPNHRYGSDIQDDEDRSWSGDDGCDVARVGDEVDRAGGAKVKADEDVPQRVDIISLRRDLALLLLRVSISYLFNCFLI
ncbi:hypothetical protein EV1_024083 [Malus domestica]